MAAISFTEARSAVHSRLGEKAAAHSERVAQTAADLAQAYCADVESARLAGLLHDWDRELSSEQLFSAAREAGIDFTSADESVPYLLHARTAAAELARAMPGLPEEVLVAVSRHTLGAPDMSDLDKIVYLADTLEPARTHHGVGKLRGLVGEVSLDELFARVYQASVAHIVSTRRRMHPDTVAVWNALVAGGKR